MVLLILPVLWAVVLLPYWVRYLRERRAQCSVRAFSSRGRNSTVRYVFGAYEPYKDGNGWEAVDALEKDISYLPPHSRPVPGSRYAYADNSYTDQRAHTKASIAYDDGYEADPYGDAYRDGLAEVQELHRVAVSAVAAAGRRADRQVSRVGLRRRRKIFFGLVFGLLASLGTAAWSGSIMAWGVHGVAVMLLAGYVSLLVHHHQRTVERSSKVRRLARVTDSRPVRRPTVVVLNGGTAP